MTRRCRLTKSERVEIESAIMSFLLATIALATIAAIPAEGGQEPAVTKSETTEPIARDEPVEHWSEIDSPYGTIEIPWKLDYLKTREELETFTYRLSNLCETQIDTLAQNVSPAAAAALRNRHEQWKRHRDVLCTRVGEPSEDPLSEYRCLATATQAYYQMRRDEIAVFQKSETP